MGIYARAVPICLSNMALAQNDWREEDDYQAGHAEGEGATETRVSVVIYDVSATIRTWHESIEEKEKVCARSNAAKPASPRCAA